MSAGAFDPRRRGLLLALGIGGAGSCIVVAPLEDPPPPETPNHTGGTGATNQGGQAGAGDTGNVGGTSGVSAGKGGASTGGISGAAGSDSGECATNGDCVERANGQPYRCRPSDHSCIPLKTTECPLAYGDAADPNAIFFGAFATLSDDRPEMNSVAWAHRLALEELSGDNVGGLPGGPDGARRPLVMIVCNNEASVVAEAVRHLARDVEVPALMATLQPGDLRRAFEAHRTREMFFLSPTAATRTLVDYDDSDLLWTMLGQPSDLAPAYNRLLGLVEAYMKTQRPEVDARTLRVALVTTSDAYNDELKNYVELGLRFNTLSAMENRDNGDYLSLTVDTENPDYITDTVVELLGFAPDVVISVTGEPMTQPGGIAESLDLQWEATVQNQARPFYILSPFNAGNLGPLQSFINVEAFGTTRLDPFAYTRFVGVSIAGAEDRTLQNSYATRLLTKFPNAITDTGNYYDATYFLAYAMYAAGSVEPLTGPAIALGMRRLLEGEAFGVGPMDISGVFDALAEAGATIELDGTLGPPDFDVDTGVKFGVASVFCFEPSGNMTVLQTDVLRYERGSGNFIGDFPCFTGFY